MFNCSCTEKDNHSKCKKVERFGSVTGVLVCCWPVEVPWRVGDVQVGSGAT